ncbi:Ig-like domain-containing protein [Clostridium sp. Marseille-QA1073]
MQKNTIKKLLSLFLLLTATLSMIACEPKEKEVVIAPDVSVQAKAEENKVKQSMELGNKYLNEGDYEKAIKAYEESISAEINNKDTYLKIKDKYIEKNRFDDAYYIIKLAIKNNVDIDNMKNILEDIKENFEAINLEDSVKQNNGYELPKDIMININGKDVNGIIKWDNNDVDTSTPGSFYYQGTIEQYGRVVNLELNINPIVIEKKIGWVKEVNDNYISLDEVEFYMYDEALNEAIKDNSKKVIRDDDTGKLYVSDSYYIRNNSDEITTYTIDENTVFEICKYLLRDVSNASEVEPVSYETLKKAVDDHERGLLCWIYTEDDKITKIEQQYIP